MRDREVGHDRAASQLISDGNLSFTRFTAANFGYNVTGNVRLLTLMSRFGLIHFRLHPPVGTPLSIILNSEQNTPNKCYIKHSISNVWNMASLSVAGTNCKVRM